MRSGSTSSSRHQVVDRADAVVHHHPPHHLAVPEHPLEYGVLRQPAPLAEGPSVDAQRAVAHARQHIGVGRVVQGLASVQQLVLAQLVVAAVGVVVQDVWDSPPCVKGTREIGRHVLLAVQIEHQPLEHIAGASLLVDQPGRDGAVPVGQVPHEVVELLSACFLVHGQPSGPRSRLSGRSSRAKNLLRIPSSPTSTTRSPDGSGPRG